MFMAIRSICARVLAGFILSFFLSVQVLAHAEFRGSDPSQDSLLDALPALVSLRFSEQVGVLVLEWRLPDGSIKPAAGEASADVLRVQRPPDGGLGTYVLRWRVASADGHPVAGSLVFSVGKVTTKALETGGKAGSLPSVIMRGVFVMALVVSVGAAVFHHLVAPLTPSVARLASLTAGPVLPFGLGWIALEGAERLGLGPSAALSAPALKAGLDSPVVFTVILAALAAPLVFAALQEGSRLAAVAALGLAAVSFAVSGHTLSAPGPMAQVATTAHAGAVILWVGGLVPLALAMRGEDRLPVLVRFSLVALPAVVVLIGSGAALGFTRIVAPDILSTDWARLLAAKLLLVLAMLSLALWHRFWAMPRLESGGDAPLRRSVALEASLGLVVLALAMGFRLAPPPSVGGGINIETISVHIHTAEAMADITATAPFPGATGFRLALLDGSFVAFDPQEVTLSLSDPLAGIGPLTAPARRVEAGLWDVPPMTLPTPGPWDVRLTLLVSDFEQITLTGRLSAQAGIP
jgi:copper transport protein